MTEKPPESKTGLTKRFQAEAALTTVAVSDQAIAKINGTLHDALAKIDFTNAKSAVRTQNLGLGIVLLGATGMVLTGSPFFFIPVFGGNMVATIFGGSDYQDALNAVDDKAKEAIRAAERELRDAIRQEGYAAVNVNMEMLRYLADQHLAEGGLLDEDSLSYLAALDPEALKGASDQLAITVLQVRRMIAHTRNGGTEAPTFASFSQKFGRTFDARHEADRKVFRAYLEETDKPLEESHIYIHAPYDILKHLENSSEAKAIRKSSGSLRLLFASGLLLKKDTANVEALKKMAIDGKKIKIDIPPLDRVKNFPEILAVYERKNGRLDLPALYGWPEGAPTKVTKKPPGLLPKS